ncbi:MAG: hypothetical protein C0399_08615 [Syntrophus sp. (in: bacteria)]|nr:hypothetical protein [Syntrophus sp. (in: bacteria)]
MIVHYLIIVFLTLIGFSLKLAGATTNTILFIIPSAYLLINIGIWVPFVKILKANVVKNKLLKIGLLLLYSSILLWRMRTASDFAENPVDAMAGLRIIQIVIAMGIGIIMLRAKVLQHLLLNVLTFMLIYSVIGILSTLYSSMPLYTLYKSLETLTDIIVIASILASCETLDDIRQFFIISAGFFLFLVLTFWIGMLVEPQLALKTTAKSLLGRQLQGIMPTLNPNKVGFISAVLIICALFGVYVTKLKNQKKLFLTIVYISIPPFILAQSRTSLVGVLVAAIVFLLLNKKFKWVLIICACAGALFFWERFIDLMVDYMRRGENPKMIQTLSGRTMAWEHAWQMFKKSPLLGYGFASGARFDVLGESGMIGLHGSIFDVLVNVGLVGVLPWLCAIFATFAQLLRTFIRYSKLMDPATKAFHTFVISLLVLLIFRALTATALVMHDIEFILFLLVLGYAQLAAGKKGFTKSRDAQVPRINGTVYN